MTVTYLTIYVSVLVFLFITISLWINLPPNNNGAALKQRLRASASFSKQLTICSLGYCVFFFVVTLAIGIGIWLIMLGLVYLPADALNNAFGDRWSQDVVGRIMPYVSRSSRSMGLFHQPILDFTTLCTLLFAPTAAIFTSVSKYKRRANRKHDATHEFNFRKNSA